LRLKNKLPETVWVVGAEEAGKTLAALVRGRGLAATWNEARRLIAGGKLFVDGAPATEPAMRLGLGARLELRLGAPRPPKPTPGRLVYDDAQVVVLDKPAGVSSVPYEARETGTAMDLIRGHWRNLGRRATEVPLHVVHRIDKETSGLLVFAKTRLAERSLGAAFRSHSVTRSYLTVAHGRVVPGRIESWLINDRGDGLRGSTREPGRGKRAITHVAVVAELASATVCKVRLETGKTHQIRIHLAESGHPLVGERVYVRDFLRRGGELIACQRLLLHAATLGFVHPATGEELCFESPLPNDFVAALERLGGSASF